MKMEKKLPQFDSSHQDGLQRTTIVSVYSEKHEPTLYTSALPFDCYPEVDQRFARKSVKNAVFANEGGENVMWVWKHADDVLKVEAHFEIHPIILFAKLDISRFKFISCPMKLSVSHNL